METTGLKHTRTCTDCGLSSCQLTLFVKNKGSKFGRRNLCIKCAVVRNNKNPKNKDWKTDHQTRKRYGIDLEEYLKCMSGSSECAICGTEKSLCYDHCHDTMKFRGVLCRRCNSALGLFKDNPELMQKAANYIRKHTDV